MKLNDEQKKQQHQILTDMLDRNLLMKVPYRGIPVTMGDDAWMRMEYADICRVDQERRDHPATAPLFTCWNAKNQDDPVHPYDRTRVRLAVFPDFYQNANYVCDLVRNKPSYICAQTPKKNEEVDFWTMVYHTRATTVVGLRSNNEEEVALHHPTILISVVKTSPDKQYMDLEMKDVKTQRVWHVRYITCLSWFQDAVPSDTKDVRRTFDLVKEGGMIVVHSLRGGGRAGTWILAHQCVKKLLSYKDREQARISVYQTAIRMLQDRMKIVNCWEQYQFAYRIVYDSLVQHGFVF